MSIHSQVFTKAHVIARSLRDNQGFEYRAAFSIALRKVWAEVKTGAIGYIKTSVRISKEREYILKLAEAYLRSRLDVKEGFEVAYAKASHFSRYTMGYICHGDENTAPYIRLRNQKNLRETVATLAHELVHAQQIKQGRLVAESHSVRIWNNEKFHTKTTAYRQRPWEIEAFDRMYGLADEFLATI